MKTSVEISLYPLKENYKEIIKDFINRMNEYKGITIETNMMSTQIFGDYEEVMNAVKDEMKISFAKHKAVFVMKVLGTNLKENQ